MSPKQSLSIGTFLAWLAYIAFVLHRIALARPIRVSYDAPFLYLAAVSIVVVGVLCFKLYDSGKIRKISIRLEFYHCPECGHQDFLKEICPICEAACTKIQQWIQGEIAKD